MTNLPYDTEIDYFKTCVDYEQHECKRDGTKYDPEILITINLRLQTNHRVHTDGGPVMVKGMNLKTEEQNRFWYKWINIQIRKENKKKVCSYKDMNAAYAKLNQKVQDENIWAFITLGFDDDKLADGRYEFHLKKIVQICQSVSRLSYQKGAVKSVKYVIEKHRECGVHHHAHFLFEFHSKIPPSNMINKIFSARGVAEYCHSKNFIDYIGPQKYQPEKPHAPFQTYANYIVGDKKESKLQFVAMDDAWRAEHNIDKIYIL